MSTAVKLSDELIRAARGESRTWSRSMTQQIEHWARIGRAVERTGAISQDRIRLALSAQLSYDELTPEEQVIALAELDQAVDRPQGNPALAAWLAAQPFASELGADGQVERRGRREA